MGHGGDVPSDRRDPYVPPPSIRTTGEMPAVSTGPPTGTGPMASHTPVSPPQSLPPPAVTGEIPTYIDLAADTGPGIARPVGTGRGRASWAPGGSVVDHPPTPAPDWMSGVEVPEMLVTQVADLGGVEMSRRDRVIGAVQRALGLVLLTLLVAVVVLVIVGSITGLGARLN